MFSNTRCLTVTQINNYLKNLVESDQLLSNIWANGEITNFKQAASGHIYFSLKDENASIKCVMFRSAAQKLLFQMENGMKVIAQGYISVYTKEGQYQLYVQEVHTMGLGDLHLAFEQLKLKLKQEGLFDQSHKRIIPILPSKIGIVTSTAGAVLHDIITVAKRRNPNVSLIIAPTSVQGIDAPAEIVKAIKNLNKLAAIDVIIVARGGGSLEELWAFNTEQVARAIFQSNVPIVSAIGHETDVTIADLVADLRAATPSAAAEILIPSVEEFLKELQKYYFKLHNNMKTILETNRLKISYLAKSKVMNNPLTNINQYKQFLDYASHRLQLDINNYIIKYQTEIKKAADQLNALSPLAILKRGYAICKNKKNCPIYKISQVKPGEEIKVFLQDGYLECEVLSRRGVHD